MFDFFFEEHKLLFDGIDLFLKLLLDNSNESRQMFFFDLIDNLTDNITLTS